jgi:hypothetical protein
MFTAMKIFRLLSCVLSGIVPDVVLKETQQQKTADECGYRRFDGQMTLEENLGR